ncbi:hypothetical protein CAPTEDRAFT_229337 [Capitella teleta]|uniref:Uncharacterized protein n=1 Tax=Capitella teleta TaxID=283909 RepID=R7VIX6_CAPTE|nr:hypothetical protein CAPTEDRAFT_229337 [Capitella teleta]|eukprot:ELU18788.1 hypothetical protein CAPTEDRAFT_229337 [Capitella teleta]
MNGQENIFASVGGALGAGATQSPAPSAPPPTGLEDDAPPPYCTLPNSPREVGVSQWLAPGAAGVAGYIPRGVRLGYMDFVPRLVKKKLLKEDEYETFSVLIQRANNWLEEHDGLQLVSCETITWTSVTKKEIFSDSTHFTKTNRSYDATYIFRGLRLWYFMDVVPSPEHQKGNMPVIQCQTFTARPSERFDQLVIRVNEQLHSNRLPGQILSVETIRITCLTDNSRAVNPELCCWKEKAEKKQIVFALRMYSTLAPVESCETIGFQDFVPVKNQRNKDNKGYELFSELMERGARWIVRQQGVRFTNMQTLPVKIKKKGPFEERCVFTEHQGEEPTNYLSILRVFFVVQDAGGAASANFSAARLTYRTFVPAQVNTATASTPLEFEDTRTLMDRINQWLQITGACLFSMETVPSRLTTGGLQLLGPEATFQPHGSGRGLIEKWLYNIRIYLDGDYVEPPGAVSLVMPSMARLT